MILTVFINGVTGFGMLIAFCFCTGPLEDVLGTQFQYPFMIILATITNSMAATTFLVSSLSGDPYLDDLPDSRRLSLS